jgi:hypothetical protein
MALLRWIELPRRGVTRSADDPPYLLPEISSSELRARIVRGESIRAWVPRGVAALLERERPYFLERRSESDPEPGPDSEPDPDAEPEPAP